MTTKGDDPLPTRASLLERVQSADDPAGWEEFFRTYRGLIHGFARKCQLSEEEAHEVVQTTMVALVGRLPGFQYEPERCRFKSWLLKVAGCRIVDFKRQRARNPARADQPVPEAASEWLDRLPEHGRSDLEQVWEAEWQQHLLNTAVERLKHSVPPLHFQIFHLSVLKERSGREVAQTLGVHVGQVYLVSHRLKKQFAKILEAVRKTEE